MDNMQVIGHGNSSVFYKDRDGNIVKVPNGDKSEYIAAQQR